MKKTKDTTAEAVSFVFRWANQGLNLGPPDYESVALTNWAISPALPRYWVKISAAKVHLFDDISKFFRDK